MKLAAAAGLVAVLAGAAVLAFQPFSGTGNPGSSPERTVYSAVYSLKHKNFGRFCSYLTQSYRGEPAACAAGNAGGWGMNAVFFNVDIFGEDTHVVAGSRVQVDENTVTFKVQLSAIPDPYVFTVKKQPSGKWRIASIRRTG